MLKTLLAGNLLMLIVFIWRWKTFPPQIPLFYNKPWGEDQLADSWIIFIIPLFINLFFYLNNLFQKKFFPENDFVKKLIFYFNLLIIIGGSLIFIKIILLVT